MSTNEGFVCPLPLRHHDRIVLGHGSGGKMSHDLINRLFMAYFDNPILRMGDDAAEIISEGTKRLAVSTDSHVVKPLFFPGGDIGRLAVCGTVNDVAMSGARPLFLTAGFILEEGLEFETLERVVCSMADAAKEAGVSIIAGDTKVVERGKADGLYINTTGVGLIYGDRKIGGAQAKEGDVVLLSGPLGDHGIAVLAARGDLGFELDIKSDVAPLNGLVSALLDSGADVHVLRDPTRGGLATSLHEIAQQSGVSISINENAIPIKPGVAAACELLGFDPLFIANEGKLIAFIPEDDAERALYAMRRSTYGSEAVAIGRVVDQSKARVIMKTRLGSTRLLDQLSGELLPRIC